MPRTEKTIIKANDCSSNASSKQLFAHSFLNENRFSLFFFTLVVLYDLLLLHWLVAGYVINPD